MSYSSQSRGPPAIEGMYSLKVDNLTYRTSPETLKRSFEKFGDIGDIYIPRDRYTKESRGFAFVRYYDKRDAEDAMDGMDGKMLDGRELRVQMASAMAVRNQGSQRYGRPSEPPQRRYGGPPRYGGGGGGGYGGYRGGGGGRYDRRSPRRRSYSRSRSRSRERHRRSYSRSRSRSRSRSKSRSRSPVEVANGRSRSRSRSPEDDKE